MGVCLKCAFSLGATVFVVCMLGNDAFRAAVEGQRVIISKIIGIYGGRAVCRYLHIFIRKLFVEGKAIGVGNFQRIGGADDRAGRYVFHYLKAVQRCRNSDNTLSVTLMDSFERVRL